MKVLVDTSAWVDFLNGHDSPERAAVAELIAGEDDVCTCGIVVAEVFQGLRRDAGREDIRRLFGELTCLEPTGLELYFRAAEIFRLLRRKGKTVRSTVDCIIAALAEQHGCYVLARDRDMDLIVSSGVCSARLWPVRQGP